MKINNILIIIAVYIIVVATGIFAALDIWKTQGLTSKVYGALNIQTNQEPDNPEFNFIYTGFDITTEGKYAFTQTNTTNLTSLKDYTIKINSRACETQTTDTTMYCKYSVVFKGYENNIILADTLSVSVALHGDKINFIFVTENEQSISYWNKHFDLKGFKIEFIKDKTFDIEEPIIDNELEPVLYWQYNGEQKSVKVENNTIDMHIVLNNFVAVGTEFKSQPAEYLTSLGFNSMLYINGCEFIKDCATYSLDADALSYTIDGYYFNFMSNTNESIYPDSNIEFTYFSEGYREVDGEIVFCSNGVFMRVSPEYTGKSTNKGELKIQGFEEPLKINLTWEINTIEI